jgi:chromosome partitioning protein
MILAIINSKGGVGKTTTAVNLACELARSGRRVQLVDLDPQGSATLHLGHEPDGAALAASLRTRSPLPFVDVGGLELVAGGPAVGAWAGEVAGQMGSQAALKRCLAAAARPDIVVLDTPPTMGTLTASAFLSATHALIPVQTEAAALLGLSQTLDALDDARELGGALVLLGIIPTLYDGRRRLDADVMARLIDDHGADLVTPPIRRTVALAEALGAGVPVRAHAPDSPGAQDYAQLAAWVLRQEGV